MFTHKMDPMVRKELDAIWQDLRGISARTTNMEKTLAAIPSIEEKLDFLISQTEPSRSIEADGAKPEPMAMSKGHIPWSQRKAQRAARTASQGFVDKVVKAAAPTKLEPEEQPNAD